MKNLLFILCIFFILYMFVSFFYMLYEDYIHFKYALTKIKRGDNFIRWDVSLKAKRRYIKGGEDE